MGVTFNQVTQIVEYDKNINVPIISFCNFMTGNTKITSNGISMIPTRRARSFTLPDGSGTNDIPLVRTISDRNCGYKT